MHPLTQRLSHQDHVIQRTAKIQAQHEKRKMLPVQLPAGKFPSILVNTNKDVSAAMAKVLSAVYKSIKHSTPKMSYWNRCSLKNLIFKKFYAIFKNQSAHHMPAAETRRSFFWIAVARCVGEFIRRWARICGTHTQRAGFHTHDIHTLVALQYPRSVAHFPPSCTLLPVSIRYKQSALMHAPHAGTSSPLDEASTGVLLVLAFSNQRLLDWLSQIFWTARIKWLPHRLVLALLIVE